MITTFLNRKEVLNAAAISSNVYNKDSDLAASYIDPDGNTFKKQIFIDHDDTEFVVYMDTTNLVMYIAFRGTSSIEDVLTDINILKKSFYDTKAHRGFVNAYKEVSDSVDKLITSLIVLNEKPKKIIFTGHSLGGALANLALCHVRNMYKAVLDTIDIDIALVTYGCPKVFSRKDTDGEIGSFYSERTLRVTNSDDIVPTLPKYSKMMKLLGVEYIHLGEHYIVGTPDGDDELSEHKIKNYIACLDKTEFA